MSPSRLAILALVPAGTIVGHALSYGLVGGLSRDGVHGYLDVVWWPFALAAVGALAWFASSAGAARGAPRVGAVVTAQVTVFFLQEFVEGLAGGHHPGAALASPAVRYGIPVQVLLALGVLLLARLVRLGGVCLRAALRTGRASFRHRPAVAHPLWISCYVDMPVVLPMSERGPPRSLGAA